MSRTQPTGAHQPAGSAADGGYPLRLLFWESTSRCNLACIHCRRTDVAEAAAAEDLPTGEVERLFGSAARLGRPIVVFSGGEPLTRPDWPHLAGVARGLGLPTALATNGTLIDAALAERIAAGGFHRVSVSFDGSDNSTHDAFRGVAGAFEAAMAGLAHLRRAAVPVQINATIAAHNVHQLDGLLELARQAGACALHLFLLVPVGCGVELAASHQLSPAGYERVLNWVCDRQLALGGGVGPPGRGGFEIKATCAPQYHRVAERRGLKVRQGRGCLAGVAVAFVSHKGEVFPCGYLPTACGDVRRQEFADIWRSSPVFADLRDFGRLKGKCGACEYRDRCGGCRARAYAATGDYLAAEPACAHMPAG